MRQQKNFQIWMAVGTPRGLPSRLRMADKNAFFYTWAKSAPSVELQALAAVFWF